MTRKFTTFAIVSLTILLAELLSTYAHHLFDDKFMHGTVYKKVALSMAVTLLIFYPAFQFAEKYVKGAAEKYMEQAQNLTRNRIIGLVIGFAFAILLLFAGFSQVEYHKNPFKDFVRWIKK